MTDEPVCTPRKGRRTTPVADQTILAGTPATIAVTLRDQDGESAAPEGEVTIGVVDSSGATVVTSGTATTGATPTGVFTAPLPAHTVDALTATWSFDERSVTTNISVVGDFHFSLAQLREMPSVDPAKYDTARLRTARRWAEELIERVCEVSFVERYQSDEIARGDFLFTSSALGTRLRFPDPFLRRVLGFDLDDTPFTHLGDLGPPVEQGRLIVTGTGATVLADVWSSATPRYVSAYTDRCPDDLRTAGLKAARYRLISTDGSSGIPARATGVNGAPSIDVGAVDADHPTGIKEVDVVICGWRDRIRAELGQ